ncbi:hypothetical protein M422DRAFT_777021 [Sphaerobolus stellatus SS14]|nr:hypothetical protein M422DRAFT_777021 [Sphaerobolus stellatus SS14]
MSSAESQRWKLLCTALGASIVTFSAVTAYHVSQRRQRREDLDLEITKSLAKSANSVHPVPTPDENWSSGQQAGYISHKGTVPVSYDESLIREQLARNYAFFGEEGMAEIRGGFVVVVVGCGGVGSHAGMMLARSGVTKIRLVDFEYVTLSSLNRHAPAGLSDVGTPKVTCIKRIIESFAKWVDVDARVDIWRKDEGGDAIDNIPTKVDLLKYCHDNKIKAQNLIQRESKSGTDISYTVYDPLARSVRRRLRPLGVTSGIPVVYSTEVPSDGKLLPLSEEEFKKVDDIAFIYEERHRGGRSVFPPFEVPTRATLTRFDLRKSLTVENCVVMELSDAQKHWASWKEAKEKEEVTSWTPEGVWGEEVVEAVKKKEKEFKEWREVVM